MNYLGYKDWGFEFLVRDALGISQSMTQVHMHVIPVTPEKQPLHYCDFQNMGELHSKWLYNLMLNKK